MQRGQQFQDLPGLILFRAEIRKNSKTPVCPGCNLILPHVTHQQWCGGNERCMSSGTGLLKFHEKTLFLEGP